MGNLIGDTAMQETCLASIEAMPFELLKKKLFSRLETMGIRVLKTYEEVIFRPKTMTLSVIMFDNVH